ncbi:MAG: lytic transglycosylase domain-containing protein [Planctomycetes bacterium]|nr:lytic transglycosylase domain-containing protein [Planctomycetota bacterium]
MPDEAATLPGSEGSLPPAPPLPEAPQGSRRPLIWGGLLFSLLGSIAILVIAHRRSVEELLPDIAMAAARHNLDADLVAAVVEAESGGNPSAVSRAQAYGLMQVRIPTARDMAGRDVTIDELFDPEVNLDLGCRYLRRMLDRYRGDVRLALMAYNAGPGKVDQWLAEEPDPARALRHKAYGETRAYVLKVLELARERKEG